MAVEAKSKTLRLGQTVWVFTEQRAWKIPISDLDLEATKKANANRDIEIPVSLVALLVALWGFMSPKGIRPTVFDQERHRKIVSVVAR
jgi:hypothetical protein